MGSISMIVYVLIGIAGAPVFAQFKAGIGILFGSTGGFCFLILSLHLSQEKLWKCAASRLFYLFNFIASWYCRYLFNWYYVYVYSD